MIYLVGPARAIRDAGRGFPPGTEYREVVRAEQLRAVRFGPDDEVRWVHPRGMTDRDYLQLRHAVQVASLGRLS